MRKKFDFKAFFTKYKMIIYIVLSLLVVYFIINKFLGVRVPQKPNKMVDKPVVKENEMGSKLSDNEANSIAERLFKAMNSFFGTDEDTIYTLLAGLSTQDYYKVYNRFGLRRYSTVFGESTISPFGVELSLTQWLVNELTSDEYKKLKKLNPNLPL